MMNKLEEKLQAGYDEYLELPKADMGRNRDAELYSNGWCILTGMACMHPHPHRHYSFTEFILYCGKDETLYNRFVENKSDGI